MYPTEVIHRESTPITFHYVNNVWGLTLDQFARAMGYRYEQSAIFLFQRCEEEIRGHYRLVDGIGNRREFLPLQIALQLAGQSTSADLRRSCISFLVYARDRLALASTRLADAERARAEEAYREQERARFAKVSARVAHIFDVAMKKRYKPREAQRKMATAVEEAIRINGTLLAEAGVGTGKTFAYLIPAIEHKRSNILVATSAHVLQDQIFLQDVQALRDLGVSEFKAYLAKGQGNYLCLKKLNDASVPEAQKLAFKRIREWAGAGNYLEAKLPSGISRRTWTYVAKDPKQQCGSCHFNPNCGYYHNRMDWKRGDGLVITNHNQLLAALGAWVEGQQGIIALPSMIVIDEAHNFLGATEDYLTRKLSSTLEREVERATSRLMSSKDPDLRRICADLGAVASLVAAHIEDLGIEESDGEDEAERFILQDMPKPFLELLKKLASLAASVSYRAHSQNKSIDTSRLEAIADVANAFLEGSRVVWIQGKPGERELCLLLAEADQWLKKTLHALNLPVIFVSATMSVAGNFSYIRRKLGITKASELSEASPFDYDRCVKVVVPREMPIFRHDNSEHYYQAAFYQIAEAIDKVEGNALVLFTSKDSVRKAKQFFEENRPDLLKRYECLFQVEDTNRQEITLQFKTQTGTCLFGTTFWEGLDVPGVNLSTVIIVKLPYPTPDPLLRREQEKIEALGGDKHKDVVVPRMLLQMKQGVGRLIRSEQDKGTIIILDRRFDRFRWQDILPFKTKPKAETSLKYLRL